MKKKHLLKTLLVFLLFWFVEIASAQTAIFNSSMAITPFGSVNSPGGEMFGNIIDNRINTKFLDFTSDDGMGFTVFLGSNAKTASSITITTANDEPGRDPKNYEILGSNDGSSFTSVATGAIGFITTRQFSRKYYFLNNTAYRYYRVNFTNTWEPLGMMQLAEVQLHTCEVANSGSISANQTISGATSYTPAGEANLNSGSSAQISPAINDYQCVGQFVENCYWDGEKDVCEQYWDYCYDYVNIYTPPHTAAQSFRTSNNVILSAIKINVANIIDTGTYTLRIFQGAGDSGTELSNQAVSIFNSGTNTFLLNTTLALTAGQPYTFKLETRDYNAKFNWTYSSDSDYQNGSGYVDGSNNNGDFNFELVYQNNVNWQNITLSNYTGGVQKWQKDTDPSFPSPVDIASTSATLASYLIGDIFQTTYFRAVVVGCSTTFSDSTTISVNPPVTPTTFTIDGIIYAVTSPTTVSVTDQNRLASGDIIIPTQVSYNSTAYTVTSISDEAFFLCVGLTSIIIPNSVTSIGESAFYACANLISVTIPSSVTSISYGTFSSCSSLLSVVIPSSVTSIGGAAFYFCEALSAVTIPGSVTSIGANAFDNCTGLTSINCNVTTPIAIDANVFYNVNQASCTLTVPAASVAAYEAAAFWQNFAPIVDSNSTVWNGTTWSNGPADVTKNAIFTGNWSASEDVTANSVAVIRSAIVTAIDGNKFTVTENVTVSPTASLTFESNAYLMQESTANNNSGNITIKRNSAPLKRLDYTLWSSPVEGNQTLSDFSFYTTPTRFYTYNHVSNRYTAALASNPFTLGIGYLIRMPDQKPGELGNQTPFYRGEETLIFNGAFTGKPNNGTITLNSLASDKYYAIGNPYPSTISADAFLDGNATDGTLYFWRKTNGVLGTAYATYTRAGGTGTAAGNGGVGAPNGTIQVGQGFIVKTGTAATSLTFTNAMRTTDHRNQFFKTKASTEKSRVWLSLNDAKGSLNQTMIAYMGGATLGVDAGYDGKYINDSKIALTSSIEGQEYIIQARPSFDASDVVALNFKTDVAGDYSIALDEFDGLFENGHDVYLVDAATGKETNLKAASYTFTATAGEAKNRFSLKYQKTLKVDAPVFNENSITVFKNNGVLTVNSNSKTIKTIQVYNVQGRLIAQQKNVNATKTSFNNLKTASQVLIVKVIADDNTEVSKKVLN